MISFASSRSRYAQTSSSESDRAITLRPHYATISYRRNESPDLLTVAIFTDDESSLQKPLEYCANLCLRR